MKLRTYLFNKTAVLMAVSLILFCQLPTFAMEKNIEDQYLKALQTANTSARIVVAKKITHSYIENQEIFAEIERQLLQGYNKCNDPEFLDLMSWYCKDLASSGNDKYRVTLAQVVSKTPCPKLQRYARQSIESIDFNKYRNKQLAGAKKLEEKGIDPHSARIAALLKSGDYKLQRDGAKMLVRSIHADLRLFDLVEDILEKYIASYAFQSSTGGSELEIDTMAWMCRALPASANNKYHDTLKKIAQESQPEKLKKYARDALD